MQASRRKRTFRTILMICTAAAVVCSSGLLPAQDRKANAADKPAAAAGANPGSGKQAVTIDAFEPYYSEVLAGWNSQRYQDAAAAVTVPGAGISGQSPIQKAQPGPYEGKNNVLIWTSDRDNWIEYQVDVPKDGLYQLNLHYHAYNDPQAKTQNRRPVSLAVTIDGAFPYREARAVPFRRLFQDELPVKKDESGDDIRPKTLEINRWLVEPFRDSVSVYAEPLKWYFGQGRHTIRLSGSEPIVIEALALVPPKRPEAYTSVVATLPPGNGPSQSAPATTIQAEAMSAKNDTAIQMAVDRDPYSLPATKGHDVFNTVGGARWATGGQTISWTFHVPESGRYKIAMRALQNIVSNKAVFRTIAIDGQVPFQELLAYRFPYTSGWQGVTLESKEGEPYEFYLAKGEHVLSMTATAAPFQPLILKTERVTGMLHDITSELKAMTGNVLDKNRTWKIVEDFPDLVTQLTAVRDELAAMADDMLQVNGRRDNIVQTIKTSVTDVERYLKYPNEIPYYMDDISAMQEKLGTLRESLVNCSLLLDQIYIAPANASFPKMEAGFFRKMQSTIANFIYSFTKKNNISSLDDKALNVWVNRGRDYVNLLQELSDQMFTPQTGIKVKVNLLPDENLLIYANAAGLTPDVALGQPQDKSIDFAMRNALQDLSEFPDFAEYAKSFAPGALLPFYYNKGYYALPETQSFKVLFYRKDILNELGLGIPDTWDDVYDMFPTLQQNGYNFYVPPTDFITFLYQNGAEFFTKDGMRTALNTPEAFKGFKMWTDLFNIYDVERNVPSFYQHFRKGDMPIGIADYNTYVTLSAAAPELTGWWGIAPLPGIKQPDGTVARWSSGGQTTGFIYKNSKRKEEAWTFLKWLLSAEVQERYGTDLESFNGVMFRWNTANIEAFTRLPWPKEDRNVILEQWKWYKEMPNPPGSYFVTRELNNAWSRTVVSDRSVSARMNYRESLEEAIVNIDREMERKEQEFGFVANDGTVLHTLDLPQVTKPWEGVDPYVAK